VKLRLAGPARRQADRIDRWWRENRPDVGDLFAREFDTARRMIPESPNLGTPYVKRHGILIRRVLLPKTRNHVYYEARTQEDIVMILAVWGAPRGRGPTLSPSARGGVSFGGGDDDARQR
jgi:hypothetical protein